MFKLWLTFISNPDSDFGNGYHAKVANYITEYRRNHRSNFIFHHETFDDTNGMEVDIYELWFESKNQAITFRLASPGGEFIETAPNYAGLSPYKWPMSQ